MVCALFVDERGIAELMDQPAGAVWSSCVLAAQSAKARLTTVDYGQYSRITQPAHCSIAVLHGSVLYC